MSLTQEEFDSLKQLDKLELHLNRIRADKRSNSYFYMMVGYFNVILMFLSSSFWFIFMILAFFNLFLSIKSKKEAEKEEQEIDKEFRAKIKKRGRK